MSSEKPQYTGRKVGRGGKSNQRRANKISKRRLTNRYEMEKPDLQSAGTSSRKLSGVNFDEFEVEESFGYRILNFVTVFTAISQAVVCKKCGSDITFTESGKRGLGFKIVITCQKCDKIEIPNSPFIEKGYEINRRIILAMRLLGVGLNGILKFCAFMDLPRPIFQSFYDVVVRRIAIAAENVCKESMKNASKEEKEKSDDNDGVTVSGDGSWRKRGFSSLFGFVSLIGWCTGKVLDVLTKSKYCKVCEYWEKKPKDSAEYQEFLESHSQECQANHEGSAGKMEPDAVVEMCKRSVPLYDVKYCNYVGDGDSKTYKSIVESFNSTVWSMAPKSNSSGKHVLDTAVYIAVGIYNDGLSSVMKLMQDLGLKIGSNCYNFCVESDERRKKFSERSLTDAAKKARLSSKSARKEEEQLSIDLDGQMYGAGIAD